MYSQSDSSLSNFNLIITSIEGDLNHDKLKDKVIVSQDTSQEKSPYKIQIYFKQSNGKYKEVVSSIQLIQPKFPDGKKGYMTGKSFSNIQIKKGALIVSNELTRGHYEHKFRFYKGNFELIYFEQIYSDGKRTLSTTKFNLLSGKTYRLIEEYGNNDGAYAKVIIGKTMIRPLPKLQDVIPFEKELY